MEGLADNLEIDMVVFDIDGTLLDFSGLHPELIPLVRRLEERGAVSYTHLTLPTTPFV